MSRPPTIPLSLALAALCALPACLDVTTADCGRSSLRVLAGECVGLENPCASDGRWVANDSFELQDSGFWILTRSIATDAVLVERQICAATDLAPSLDRFVEYVYGVEGRRTGAGSFLITTAPALEVAASAVPQAVTPGQKVDLKADVKGGAPPYSYAWSPADEVSQADASAVTATPSTRTAYRVTVTDSIGQQEEAGVEVDVVPPDCGNGIVDIVAGEQCDDFNTVDGDGCSSSCVIEGACRPAFSACLAGNECCSGTCLTDVNQCAPSIPSCLAGEQPCSVDDECCSLLCRENVCKPN